MTDLDIAVFLIKSAASVAEGGGLCRAQRVLARAMELKPDLPWKLAAEGLASEGDEYEFALRETEAAMVGDLS